MSILMLLLSLLALALGPLLYRLVVSWPATAKLLDAIVVLAVGLLVIGHVLPEAMMEAGWGVLVFLIAGLLGPTVLERYAHKAEAKAHTIVILIVTVGLAIHASADGIALGLPGHHDQEHLLPAAIVLHRLPASLVIWRLLRPERGRAIAALALVGIGISTLVGYGAAETIAGLMDTPALGLFQGWVAGSLLHAVVHPGRQHSHH